MIHTPHILAAGIGDLFDNILPFLVFVLVVVGSIAKGIAEARKKKSDKPRGEAASPPTGQQPTTRQRMDDLAEQRKRQLQELARRRHQTTTTQRGPTMPSETGAQQRSSQEEADRQRRRAEAMRQHQERRQRGEAQLTRRQQQLRQQAQQARQREADHRAQQMRDLERNRQPDAPLQRAEPARMAVSPAQVGHETEQVHRHVANAPTPAHRVTGHAAWARQLRRATPQQLQQAIILKEIFEPPLAMRDPVALPMER